MAELWSIKGIQLLNSLDRGSSPLLTNKGLSIKLSSTDLKNSRKVGLVCSAFKKNKITPEIECVYGGHVINTILYQTVNHEYA